MEHQLHACVGGLPSGLLLTSSLCLYLFFLGASLFSRHLLLLPFFYYLLALLVLVV